MIVEYKIKNEEGMLTQGKGNYYSKFKKGKLKTKNFLKITRYIRWTKALSTIIKASLKLRKYLFTKHGKWSSEDLYSYLFENKWWVPCQKESQATISERIHVQWSFIQPKIHLDLRPCNLNNTLNRPSNA